MKQWRIVMGMPVTIEITGDSVDPAHFERLYSYFEHVEEVFSPYRATSETSRINSGLLRVEDSSEEMRTVIRLAEKTRVETKGYFDVNRDGVFNPVGIVKGWAVYQASEMLRAGGHLGLLHRSRGRHPALRSQRVRRRLGASASAIPSTKRRS